jgi:hypothetical protein
VTGDVVVPRDGDGDHHGMGGPADVLVTEAAERTSWMPVPGWNGENHLICRSLGTQAMTANAEGRHLAALELAQQACEYADTPLRRAPVLAWSELRSLARRLGPRA